MNEPNFVCGRSECKPLLTVAMPIFNAGKFLRMAVLSIVQQTYSNWELLIIDDGSTDDALQSIVDISDSRIKISRDGLNKGLAARLNEAIKTARGEYFARMDQDDVSYPERFTQQLNTLLNDTKLDLVAARAIMINEDNCAEALFPYRTTHAEICEQPWRGFYLPHPTWVGKIEWFRKFRYAEPGAYFCEDQELLLRAYQMSNFATVENVLFAYRIRSNINFAKLKKTYLTVRNIQANYFSQTKQWKFWLLANLVFIGRVLVVWYKRLIPKAQNQAVAMDAGVLLNWHLVLGSVCDN